MGSEVSSEVSDVTLSKKLLALIIHLTRTAKPTQVVEASSPKVSERTLVKELGKMTP